MSSLLYQTFYPYNKFDDIKNIPNLQKWMLYKSLYLTICNENKSENNEENISTQILQNTTTDNHNDKTNSRTNLVIPDKGDTLFWCMYISHYGEDNYLAIGNRYGNAEIAEKQKIMEFLKTNKHILKNVNRKITLGEAKEIISDLVTNTKTSLQTLSALSVFYKKNILLLNKNNKTYLEYVFDKNQSSNTENDSANMQWLVIEYTENKKYGFFVKEVTNILQYTDSYIRIENHNKPLKGISTYKMSELVAIASNIPELAKESKLSKPELYGKIWHHCLWI